MPTCEARLNALYRFDQVWIDGLKHQIKVLEYQLAVTARSLITGDEITILGKPIHVELTWPDGRPYNLTDEQILEMIPVPELPQGPAE